MVRTDVSGFGNFTAVDVMDNAQFLASAGRGEDGNTSFWVCSPKTGGSELVRYTVAEDGTLIETQGFVRPIRKLVYAIATGPDGRLYVAYESQVLVFGGEDESVRLPVELKADYETLGIFPRSLVVLSDGRFVLSGLRAGPGGKLVASRTGEANWKFMLGQWDDSGRKGDTGVMPRLVNASGLAVVGGRLIGVGHRDTAKVAELALFGSRLRQEPKSLLAGDSERPFRALGVAVSGSQCLVLDARPSNGNVGRPFEANRLRFRLLLYTLE
jgi:hypothetical protein